MIYQRLFKEYSINKKWISEKLYALNKLPKQMRDGKLENFPFTYNELYNIKDNLLKKYGKPTGVIHKFEKGIGEEWTIVKGDSFHMYYAATETYFNKNTNRCLENVKIKSLLDKFSDSRKIELSFYFANSKDEEDYYEYGFRVFNKGGDNNDYSVTEVSDSALIILKKYSNYYTPKELLEDVTKLPNISSNNEKNISISVDDIKKLKKLIG